MGSGLICAGKKVPIPGLDVTNWTDDPVLRLRKGEDFAPRSAREWIRAIILHSSKGLPGSASDPPQKILPGLGPSVNAGERTARYWSTDGRNAGAHLVVDQDGAIFQTSDIITEAAYSCPRWNFCGVGIEIYESAQAEIYEGALDACVALVDALTVILGIQRQIPHRYIGPVKRLVDGDESVVGVLGHRDCATNRGPGDPGSAIFYRLGNAGYEDLDFSLAEERDVWRRRQRDWDLTPDGIPGAQTITALKAHGYPAGLWVKRPGDEELLAVLAAGASSVA